jgi:hypothetical protein|eukprot:jgi/Chrpa1/6484/Chrysochromulina_OHIO_Genome00001439-RA
MPAGTRTVSTPGSVVASHISLRAFVPADFCTIAVWLRFSAVSPAIAAAVPPTGKLYLGL